MKNQINDFESLLERISALENYVKNVNPLLTSKEVYIYTGLSKSTIDKFCANGKLIYTKPNNKNRYFKKSDIDNFLLTNSK